MNVHKESPFSTVCPLQNGIIESGLFVHSTIYRNFSFKISVFSYQQGSCGSTYQVPGEKAKDISQFQFILFKFRMVLDSFLNVCSHTRCVSFICLHGLFTFQVRFDTYMCYFRSVITQLVAGFREFFYTQVLVNCVKWLKD